MKALKDHYTALLLQEWSVLPWSEFLTRRVNLDTRSFNVVCILVRISEHREQLNYNIKNKHIYSCIGHNNEDVEIFYCSF